ncbi:u2 small nuclear ribonucleoprotein a [Anaeramoeba flamelloides]|uniref:U2 small nuclear ribonucleoprotein a n=1 Tax=Anaeramoeba flamelloides TaxID=1746091 RepID=A0ABQ8YG18_9EUKA|nr:u2 small nuclear ribonucleoprotein a [Anaeramoeba flamelloides]
MSGLSVDLILSAPSFRNPLNETELCLRSHRIPMIQNLGVTLDQYDCIDLSNNNISRLENFPLLQKLRSLFVCNNNISKIDPILSKNLPNLHTLILTGNRIQELSQLEHLSGFKKLERISLVRNPICQENNYRLFLIHKIPSIKYIDFQKVKLNERKKSQSMYSTTSNQQNETISEFDPNKDNQILNTIEEVVQNSTTKEQLEELSKALKEDKIEKVLEKKEDKKKNMGNDKKSIEKQIEENLKKSKKDDENKIKEEK